jgi:aryl-alcohol dehydrogenase-like predicted oxidoreductase
VKRQADVEILPLAQHENLGVITYNSLGGGLLTGKYDTRAKPEHGRLVDNVLYTRRYQDPSNFETAEAKEIYKQRAEVAEFPNAWIKDKIGLRQFRLRGLVKVTLESMWVCLTYNISQWIRLCWKPQRQAAA